jgi:hypothetical protein
MQKHQRPHKEYCPKSARRRRSGGGPGEGCACRPAGTYLYLHAVGAGNPVAVPGLGRQGAKRGADNCDPREAVGKPGTEGFEKHNIRTPAHGSLARPVRYVFSATKLKLKLKLFTTCTVCAGLHQTPYAPVVVSGPSQLCHTRNLQVKARPLTT